MSDFRNMPHDFAESELERRALQTKLFNYCRKLCMFHFAGNKTINWEREFISTQDRSSPVLIWKDETELLYHLEAMLLFGRSALDIFAYILAKTLFHPLGQKRIDSFNKFSKELIQSDCNELVDLKNFILESQEKATNWHQLLCGVKGRALRDKVAHQTIARIEYIETNPNSEKESCHIVVSDSSAVPLAEFVESLTGGVFQFCFIAEDAVSHRISSVRGEQQ